MVIRRVQIRDEKGSIRPARRITNVWEVKDFNNYIEIAKWNPIEDSFSIDLRNSVMLRRIGELTGLSIDSLLEELEKRKALLEWLVKTGKNDYRSVSTYIYRYYVDPINTLRIVGQYGA
jgi:flagellar protein FlaI